MIESINFAKIEQSSAYRYAKKLDYFAANTEMHFKPGLNIIFAPNGTGKSTILEILAKFTASEQGGVSTVTRQWCWDMLRPGAQSSMEGLEVRHDGKATMYANPRKAVGLLGGMAAFDDDFFSEGIDAAMLKESTGVTTMHRMQKVLAVLAGKEKPPEKIESKIGAVNPDYDRFLKASISEGQPTLILDEPESGLAVHVQSNLFRIMASAAVAHNLQIIVATHSLFALPCKANFIELLPGYVSRAKQELELLHLQLEVAKLAEANHAEQPS